MSPRADVRGTRLFGIVPLWTRYGGILLWGVVTHALITAVLRLMPAFDALIFLPEAAIDLLIRYEEVQRWFAGESIYGDDHSANYPPGSYSLLWPLLGWLPQAPVRGFYAFTVLLSCGLIGAVAVRASCADRLAEKAFFLVFILPLGATMITVWIGQLGLHVTAALLGGAWLLVGDGCDTATSRQPRSWARDAVAAALLTTALVKPTLSLPLLVVILVLAGGWRPALMTAALYGLVTLIAAVPQGRSPVTLAFEWLSREEIMNLPLGSVNVYLWLHWLGFEGSMIPVSLVILTGVSLWAWRYRAAPPWLLIGVAALVSRLWIHHRAFDDVLLIIPAIALFQAAKTFPAANTTAGKRGIATVAPAFLLAVVYVLGHAPYAYLGGEHYGGWLFMEVARTIVWLAVLGLLMWHVHRSLQARATHGLAA
ncbi:MAG: hypothetical protein WD960_00855 [Gemmatimonadota bacterium]